MAESTDVVRVHISGQEYVIKTSANADYIKSVADYVNKRMQEIKLSSPDSDSQLRTAILASMNITDELFMEQKKRRELTSKLEAKVGAIREYVMEKIETAEDR